MRRYLREAMKVGQNSKKEREREKHMEKGEATLEAENLKSHI